MIDCNIILPFTASSTWWSLPFSRFRFKFCASISSPHAFCMSRSFHPPWFDHPNNIWCRVQITKILSILLLLPSYIQTYPQHSDERFYDFTKTKIYYITARCHNSEDRDLNSQHFVFGQPQTMFFP